ncbi:hypothetical protein IWQ62_004688 [Dispira parvispora]|uniref:Uncharacterized protein n=1 Tax=Dispira parvispora TaxID=1520584 RepID=A0A9W8E5X4_9FUNG|nr:hypothetical protein IWQ62_004688 [Dispira parvispora]
MASPNKLVDHLPRDFRKVALGAILVRMAMYWCLPGLVEVLQQRIEWVTPLTSYKRLTEGLFLYRSGIDPYDGNQYFQPALYLPLFQTLAWFPTVVTFAFFVLLDVLVAWQLYQLALTKFGRRDSSSFAEDQNLKVTPAAVAACYLWNPLTILSTLSQATSLVNTLAVVCALRHGLQGQRSYAMVWLAVATYISFYPVMLLVPLVFMSSGNQPLQLGNLVPCLKVFALTMVTLLSASYLLTLSPQLLSSTYGVIFTVTDLTPNLGVFWYFFIEMFDHFRAFFLIAFQLHTFIFAVPISIRFRHQPLFASILLLGIITLFKSYPSVSDMVLYLALLPLYHEIFKYMRYSFLLVNAMIYALVLAPLFWHLWIYQGSGNANFFYAATLVYAAFQIFLIIDLTQSQLRRDLERDCPAVRSKILMQE